jgi:POT family proton-dependent oligopeptide transporter
MSRKDRHPPGLAVLFFTEMWERFGFYSMLAMFTLYLRDDKQGFGWTSKEATTLYSNYLMFVYASPLVGGWIADKKLGYRNSVLLGGLIFMVGYFLLSVHSLSMVYLALTCLVIGNGFFKPNVSAMVGQLYPEGSPLKDRAYNIFYMGINVGALLAPINAEIMVHRIGFNQAFAIAGFGMIISVTILWSFKQYVEGPYLAGAVPPAVDPAVAATSEDVPPPVRRSNPIDAVPDSTRVGALIVIFLIVIVFWMVFHQNGSTLTYWADDNTDWKVSGIIANAINPFWVVTLSLPVVWFWRWLDSKGLEPSTPTKMALGMFLTAGSFTILYCAGKTGEAKEVRPDMYPSGSFRVTERSLGYMRAEGVPDAVLQKLEETKYPDNKFIVKDRKFSPDETFEEAFDTIKRNLNSEGLPADASKKLKEAKIEDAPLGGDKKFADALAAVVQKLRDEGVSSDVLAKIQSYQDKKFTGEEKLLDAVTKVIGPEETARYQAVILKNAFLFKVSPLWLIIAFAVVTLGELMLSPMGLSLVSKVAPIRLRGLMMGGWFVATAIGNKLTMIGVFWDRWLQSTFFAVLGSMALVMAFVLVILLRPLKKAMPGV